MGHLILIPFWDQIYGTARDKKSVGNSSSNLVDSFGVILKKFTGSDPNENLLDELQKYSTTKVKVLTNSVKLFGSYIRRTYFMVATH